MPFSMAPTIGAHNRGAQSLQTVECEEAVESVLTAAWQLVLAMEGRPPSKSRQQPASPPILCRFLLSATAADQARRPRTIKVGHNLYLEEWAYFQLSLVTNPSTETRAWIGMPIKVCLS